MEELNKHPNPFKNLIFFNKNIRLKMKRPTINDLADTKQNT